MGDALESLKGGTIVTMDGETHCVPKWDMLIAHPPCTYLTNAGAVRMRVNGKICKGHGGKRAFYGLLDGGH